MKKWFLIPLLAFPLVFLTWSYLHREPKTAVAQIKEVKKFVYASGYVEPEDFVLVKSEVSGIVEAIYVKEGDKVKKGQVLAKISAQELESSIKDLQARLSLVEERLRENSPYLRSLKEKVEASELQLRQAEREYERRKDLAERGLIPKEQLERFKTTYEIHSKEYEANLSQYRDAIRSLQTESKSLRAQMERLNAQREKYLIKSPINGVVLSKFVKEGSYINHLSQENVLFGVGDPSRMEVVLEIDEEYVGLIKEGQRVFLSIDAFPGQTFEGTIYSKEGQLDRTRKTLKVKVRANLPPNTPAFATVEGKVLVEEKSALLVPREAVKDGKVLRYERVRSVEVPVKLGGEYEGYVEVLEGLKEGDRVILR
jgi:RND family efflux transporter, MFP subunit